MITLGVIGVVAALTIPAVITNYQKQETLSRLKKAYSIVQQAIKLSEVENESVTNWDNNLNGHDFFEKYIKNTFSIHKKLPLQNYGQWHRENF